MWKIVFLAVIAALGILSFYPSTSKKFSCLEDSDCVAATCCHPTACINKNYTPDCRDIFCSMECKPGTMDCGQGYCACIENKCTAVLRE